MPDSSMAAKRTIPPEEPSRDMARATAERNTVNLRFIDKVYSVGEEQVSWHLTMQATI